MQTCPHCNTTNDDGAERCSACAAPLAPERQADDESPHQNFARRLIELRDSQPVVAPSVRSVSPERPHLPTPASRTNRLSEPAQAQAGSLQESLKELHRQASLVFFASLLLHVTFASIMILATASFFVVLLTGASRTELAVSAAAALFGLAGFFAVQLSPLNAHHRRLAVLIARFETACRTLNRELDLWEHYLSPSMGLLGADEISLAVDSLSRSAQAIIAELSRDEAIDRPGAKSTANPPAQRRSNANPAVAAKY
jgi:hypothetical protein